MYMRDWFETSHPSSRAAGPMAGRFIPKVAKMNTTPKNIAVRPWALLTMENLSCGAMMDACVCLA
jgi:hypothetical protein